MMSKKIILIVDDQGELRKLVRMTLEYGDYELHEAENGQRALELAKVIKPDLVLLDVMMPGEVNGYQVCEKLKQANNEKNPYVMLLTARGQKSDLEEGRRVGADSYLVKPFSPLELIKNVENALA
ncbi:two-component system, chemotaxis family, response regulator CheY [Glaciecola pallidula DSM 14239 = ACAM 615]|uniref:Two-component system, chemotaxis family, response regulator CheY n=2 Tax=Brumicola TaxID=3160924 RepID=K6YVZ5_9ALTE|nr:two-component system, chemotaxis family, response regulator CheY [Glaciecola pallidula DSM 14239 = ACAM 615]